MRTIDEIREEYKQVCIALGDAQVQIKRLEKAVAKLMVRVDELNDEVNKRAEFDKAVAEQTAATPPPAEPAAPQGN